MSRGILTTVWAFSISIFIVIAGFFLLDIEKAALTFWAFGSLLFSLIVSLLIMVMLVAPRENRTGLFFKAGLGSAVWLYEIAVAVSVLFTRAFVDRLNSFIFIQIGINALFFIIVIVLISVSEHVLKSNEKTYKNLQNGEYNKPKKGGF